MARMTTGAQLVAALPLQLGFTPSESLVIVCCHEPRGRVGLTLRIDLPVEALEVDLVDSLVGRVRHEQATRVALAVYTEQGGTMPRQHLVDDLRLQLGDLVLTEALLVRSGRFWSYVCSDPRCCPTEGRSIEEAAGSSPVQLLAMQNVLAGRSVLPDRAAVAASLAGPTFLVAEVARQCCQQAGAAFDNEMLTLGAPVGQALGLQRWRAAVDRFGSPPAMLDEQDAARLAMTLHSKAVRDDVATWVADDEQPLLALVGELCRRTPAPYDAPVATLLGWLSYAVGGGAVVVIALERALTTDPDYELARLLLDLSSAQVRPAAVRAMLAQEARRTQWAS